MEKHLLKKLSQTTDEERAILAGASPAASLYFDNKSLIKSEKVLTGRTAEIGIKTHARYAAFPEHSHNYVEMMIVLSGSVTHHIGKKTICLGAGDILLMNKHVRHSIERAERGDLGVNIIMTDAFVNSLSPELSDTVFEGFIKDNAKGDGSGAFLHFSTGEKKPAENLIENIIFELTEQKANTAILSRTLALLFSYLSQKGDMLSFAGVPISAEEGRKSAIITYIKSNYRKASLTELSANLFLSTPYLSKLTVAYFGKSFKAMLREERLARADKLITETDMSVGEIIRSVGYENVSYFHREYKAHFKKTPLERRKASKSA